MANVFISFAAEDELAESRLRRALDDSGHRVSDAPAESLDSAADRIAAADKVLVLWSERASASAPLRAVAGMALARRKLVQLSLDGSAPPLGFAKVESIDLAGWSGEPAHSGWEKLVAALGAARPEAKAQSLGAPPPRQADRASSPPPQPERPAAPADSPSGSAGRQSPLVVALASVGIVVLAGGAWALTSWQKRAAPPSATAATAASGGSAAPLAATGAAAASPAVAVPAAPPSAGNPPSAISVPGAPTGGASEPLITADQVPHPRSRDRAQSATRASDAYDPRAASAAAEDYYRKTGTRPRDVVRGEDGVYYVVPPSPGNDEPSPDPQYEQPSYQPEVG